MAVNVTATLRGALRQLEAQRDRIEQQISALQTALGSTVARGRRVVKTAVRRRRRRKMSAAARKAVSQRMKAYWAARRAGKK